MSESYTVQGEGYLGRLGGALKGVIVGVIFFLGSFILLFWNEGRAVHRASVLEEVSGKVVTVDAKAISPGNEGRPVHFTGDATGQPLADDTFTISENAIHLERVAEMYQWKEDRKKDSGRDTYTYTYDKVWDDDVIDSGDYKVAGHDNPRSMRLSGDKWTAKTVTVGAFTLPPVLVEQIDNFETVRATEAMLADTRADLKDGAVVANGMIYLPVSAGAKANPASPRIGDVRVTFRVARPGPVSVIAQQAGSTLVPYPARDGDMAELHVGTHTAEGMIRTEQTKNTILTWVLRGVGFIVMWVGLAVFLHPLKALADVIGIIGDLVGAGVVLMSGVVAFVLSLTTVAFAWVFYRPLLGIGLMAVAGAGVWLFLRMRRQGHAKWLAAAAMPPVLGVNPPLPAGAGAPAGYPGADWLVPPGPGAGQGAGQSLSPLPPVSRP